jgi:lysyl-tRNA synthetase class I
MKTSKHNTEEALIDMVKRDMGDGYYTLVYFCEACKKKVNITSNPERLYFCDCGHVGDYTNCEQKKLGEYIFPVLKKIIEKHGNLDIDLGKE